MKRPTLQDVAQAAEVSRSAAAKVLLGTGGDQVRVAAATALRIERVAKRLRYTPNRLAQQLRGVSSRTIGVLIDTLNTPVMSQRLFALESEASRRGYRLLIGQTHEDAAALRDYAVDFEGRAAEALLCLFDLSPGRDERAGEAFKSFRKVVFHGRPAWPGGYGIRVDTEAAVEQCLTHLETRGRKVPAMALWNCRRDELMKLRRSAFEEQTSQRGMRGILWDARASDIVPSSADIAKGIDHMISRQGADAIMASNDVWATRFVLALQQKKIRVPEDVAVIGYDNLDIASVVSPALSTVDQCHEEYACAAMELLLQVGAGHRLAPGQRVREVTPRLIIREST